VLYKYLFSKYQLSEYKNKSHQNLKVKNMRKKILTQSQHKRSCKHCNQNITLFCLGLLKSSCFHQHFSWCNHPALARAVFLLDTLPVVRTDMIRKGYVFLFVATAPAQRSIWVISSPRPLNHPTQPRDSPPPGAACILRFAPWFCSVRLHDSPDVHFHNTAHANTSLPTNYHCWPFVTRA